MSIEAGHRAERDLELRCENCSNHIHVSEGDVIPKCPSCGSERYYQPKSGPGDAR
ncbi:hypothetical protein [Jiella sp. M17.18]|uniref:zinc ribbon-containing protein n=1 Tax=Jiella sp. M17.18 TaxID=3234247 RepID=UPI0034E00553